MSFENLIARLTALRYWLLCGVLFVIIGMHISNGKWYGDFWEHMAVLRELKAHPWNPLHPIILDEAPHSFYSPYSLLLALLARLFSLTEVNALAGAAIVNLILLLIFFWYFLKEYFHKNSYGIAFYSLLMILFLWGAQPWYWSGFFHLGALGYVLPYPSTFAMVLTFCSMTMFLKFFKYGNKVHWMITVFLLAMVLLIHPNTALALLIYLFCIAIDSGTKALVNRMAWYSVTCILGFLIASVWPYYNFLELLFAQSADFHSDSETLYVNIFSRGILPALVALPLIIIRLVQKKLDFIALSFVLLVLIYLYGYFSGKWGYGRAISQALFLLQITLGYYLATLETKIVTWGKQYAISFILLFTISITYIVVYRVNPEAKYILGDMVRPQPPAFKQYEFLERYVKQYDVVIADPLTSWVVPAWSGKVIASIHPLPFISDINTRRKDLKDFFDSSKSNQLRLMLIKRYKARFILLNKMNREVESVRFDSLVKLGTVVYSDSTYVLIDVDKMCH